MPKDANTQVCLLAGHNRKGPDVLAYVEKMQPGHGVALVREATNQFDKNAVQVHAANGEDPIFIGFIAKAHNHRVSAWMDAHPNDHDAFDAVFGYAGSGVSKVPAIHITFPKEIVS